MHSIGITPEEYTYINVFLLNCWEIKSPQGYRCTELLYWSQVSPVLLDSFLMRFIVQLLLH